MRRALFITKWGYPFGGGEEFMLQSLAWLSEAGYEAYWVSFTDATNREWESLKIKDNLIFAPGGMTEKNVAWWIDYFQPDFVHHQGHSRLLVSRVCKEYAIPLITGFHFWIGLVDLGKEDNVNILKNLQWHTPSPEFEEVLGNASAIYLVSEFMQKVVKKITGHIFPIIHPIPNAPTVVAETSSKKATLITLINTHPLKGGKIFLKLVKAFPDYSFLAISSEGGEEISERLASFKNCQVIPRTNNIKEIYGKTKILIISSLVDETYCRVAAEALLNRIPIITTGAGHIKNITGDAALYPSSTAEWKQALASLMEDKGLYKNLRAKAAIRAKLLDEKKEKKAFLNLIKSIMPRKERVMIFTPWCDQGLGIQSRVYCRILENSKIITSIFAFKPYWEFIERRESPEWNHPRIYRSPNTREDVKNDEIKDFVEKFRITHCLIPEICFSRIFSIASLLKELGVSVIAIPNIEIVRRSELEQFQIFDKILCNNRLCQETLESFNVQKCHFLGFALPPFFSEPPRFKAPTEEVEILFLGGLNSFTRKCILQVLQAFSIASKVIFGKSKMHLTACIQYCSKEEEEKLEIYKSDPQITIISKQLTYNEINELYKKGDLGIQVSRQEGLGLGFYEFISHGVPCISLDTPPHNETIKHLINGYLIPCHHEPMQDNLEGIIESAVFSTSDLVEALVKIVKNRKFLFRLKESTRKDYIQNYDFEKFSHKLPEFIN